MPEEVAKAWIAHELAHVYQHATGTKSKTYDELETGAEDLVASWGFDWVAKNEWRAKREMGLLD